MTSKIEIQLSLSLFWLSAIQRTHFKLREIVLNGPCIIYGPFRVFCFTLRVADD